MKVKKQGGSRPNSGRKKLRPTTTVTIRVPAELANYLKQKFKELVNAAIQH